MKSIILVILLSSSCAGYLHPPVTRNLSPQGIVEFHTLRAMKDLAIFRDAAVDAEANHVLSTKNARRIVAWHLSVVRLAESLPDGWRAMAAKGLDELLATFTPAEQKELAPYVIIAKLALKEILLLDFLATSFSALEVN